VDTQQIPPANSVPDLELDLDSDPEHALGLATERDYSPGPGHETEPDSQPEHEPERGTLPDDSFPGDCIDGLPDGLSGDFTGGGVANGELPAVSGPLDDPYA
jgi:hypothetical protein